MSQHVFHTLYQNKPADVIIGWDHPLGHYFMTVTLTDFDESHEDYVEGAEDIYSNLSDPYLKGDDSVKVSFDYFVTILNAYDIELPSELLVELHNDRQNNIGNKTNTWFDPKNS